MSIFTWMRIYLSGFAAFVFICFGFLFAPSIEQASASADGYTLSAGDIVTFDFLDDTELPVQLTITSDGAAQFPLIGSVPIVGLTITDTLAKLRNEYIKREILVDPKISLNITTLRPVFVLGEVKSPGSFPYYSGLTVEQAVGLAGGTQTAATNPSDRIIARARLRGEIDGADTEIVHEAIYTARLKAQLAGRQIVDMNDIPEIARDYVNKTSLKGVIEIEEQILKTDLDASKSQIQIISDGMIEGEAGIKILDELIAEQKQVVDNTQKDLDRADSLRQRALNTESDVSRAKSNASTERARLLEIYSEMSKSRRDLGSLKLELAKLTADRENDLLTKLQERDVSIKKLLAKRQSAEEQFFLMAAATADETKKSIISFTYQIRRNTGSKSGTVDASAFTEVLPGDVLVVAIAGM